MSEHTLRNCRILVVEDEYYLAEELDVELQEAGAKVLGPVGTVEDALAIIAGEADIDAAILDASVRGQMIFPAADALVERGTPFVFATGYDASIIPARFKHIERCEKPVDTTRLMRAIGRAIHA